MKQLFINDIEIDLSDDVIAISYQAVDIQDITTRRFSHTNRFKVPKTKNNINAFGLSNNINSTSNLPYIKLNARLLDNEMSLIVGDAIIESVEDSFNIELYDGVHTFFELLGDKTVSELNLSSHNTPWAAADMDAKRNTTTGVVAPIMSYGKFITTPSNDINDAFYLPSVYYHTVIEKIISEAGYTKQGPIFTEDKYLKTIVPFSRPSNEYADSFHNKRVLIAASGGFQTINNPPGNPTIAVPVKFPIISKLGGLISYTNEERYNKDLTQVVYGIKAIAVLQVTVAGLGGVSVVIDTNSGAWIAPSSGSLVTGDHYFTLDSSIDNGFFKQGGFFEVKAFVPGGASMTINYGLFKIIVDKKIDYQEISIADILPDITQKELMRDFAIRNGLLFKEANKVLICKNIDAIINDRTLAIDWTSKRDHGKIDNIKFINNNYAQSNIFNYSEESTKSVPVQFGEGIIVIENDSLELRKDFYTSPFSLSANENIGGVYMAIVPIWKVNTTSVGKIDFFDNDPGIRLLIVANKRGFEPSVIYNTIARTDYLTAGFDDPTKTNSLRFQKYIDLNYKSFILALQKLKIINRTYKLSLIDLLSIDPFTLIYDDQVYYMINKISNYVSGKLTKVELLKVS